MEVFYEYFTPKMVDIIVKKTNRYAASKPTTQNPFKKRHNMTWSDVSEVK